MTVGKIREKETVIKVAVGKNGQETVKKRSENGQKRSKMRFLRALLLGLQGIRALLACTLGGF